jgi:hypothetical protein
LFARIPAPILRLFRRAARLRRTPRQPDRRAGPNGIGNAARICLHLPAARTGHLSRSPMFRWVSCVLCLAVAGGSAASVADPEQTRRHWNEAVSTMAQARQATPGSIPGVYRSGYGMTLHLAPGGESVMTWGADADGATTGRYRREGNWIEVTQVDHVFDIDAAPPGVFEAIAEAVSELIFNGLAAVFDDDAAEDADAPFSFAGHEPIVSRLLLIPHAGGHLLLQEEMLEYVANNWSGDGPLTIDASYWNLPGRAAGEDEDASEFVIDAPMEANLPHELARMLRRERIELQAVERLQELDDLVWERHATTVRLLLDRGEQDGVFAGMRLHGIAPNTGRYGKVVEVAADHAIGELPLQRFHPDDAVELPAAGIRFASRGEPGQGCGLDFSIAARARITAVSSSPGALRFDADGFAWLELTIDQGSAHGLAIGDALSVEDEYGFGEGRVKAVQSQQATVLWRVQRYFEEQELDLPAAGRWVVTPAWQRHAYEMFGAPPSSPVEHGSALTD